MSNFETVREYLLDLEMVITNEDTEAEVFVVEKEDSGIKNLVVACADPIVIIEQHLFDLKNPTTEILSSLLKKNRDIIFGAFVLDDEAGEKVIFRDTLALENLDLNELEGSINSLELLLSEFSDEIIKFSKN